MDKKTGIIIGIITAVIVVLVAVVFAMEGKTEKVDSNVILTLNGENYTVDEFNIFSKLTNNESDDINKKMTEDEVVTMMNNFIIRNIIIKIKNIIWFIISTFFIFNVECT